MRITRKTTRKLLIELATEYRVRLHFFEGKHQEIDGDARYWNYSISVRYNQSPINMISTFFHEVGHIYCWENKIWKSYHINKSIDDLTKDEKRRYVLTALKAERWVEKWAKKEMKKHFTGIKYIAVYSDKLSGEEFSKYIKEMIYGKNRR
jgi:hypothetical protein